MNVGLNFMYLLFQITVEPTLVLEALGDTIYDIGEVQQYTGYLIVPPGLSYSQLNVSHTTTLPIWTSINDKQHKHIYDL